MKVPKVLVLGGSGHIGQRWRTLQVGNPLVQVSAAARHAAPGSGLLRLDSRDLPALTCALQGMDAVINCVAGDAASIAEGTQVLCRAARAAGRVRIVHLSTQSVYGAFEGQAHESMPLEATGLGWYAQAKCQAEASLRDWAQSGGQAVILRPGCVYGPGSQLWVGRIGRWLQAGRLGDLGAAGDGWSNLVHVDDVCHALSAALRLPLAPGELPVFNLAAPDSPRWNPYFVALALAIDATPVRRLSPRQLQLDAWLAGVPLHLGRRALQVLGRRWGRPFVRGLDRRWPDPLTPGLLRLWQQQIHLDASAASRRLGVPWTPFASGLAQSAAWFLNDQAGIVDTDYASCAT